MTYPDASFASLAITFPVSTTAWGRMLIPVKATTLWISFSVPATANDQQDSHDTLQSPALAVCEKGDGVNWGKLH